MKTKFCIVPVLLLCSAFPAFFPAFAGEDAARKLTVVTTIGMITDIVHEIAGNEVALQGLMGAGIDPHLYKPTRSDIALLNSADIVFYNGLLLEGKMTDAFIRVASSGKKVFAVTQLLPEDYLLEPDEFQGHYDPHVWMDPRAWRQAVLVVRDKLIESRPQAKELFAANTDRYLKQLEELDGYTDKVLASVPANARILVTAHDAFNYFGKRYSYEVLGIQGISTESEAGVKDIERIVDVLVERKVGAVFVESTVSERNIRALIEGAGARGHEVKIGGQLFSDAFGKAGTYEGTYIGMIDHNVTAIARALGGAAPPRGMQGKLSQ